MTPKRTDLYGTATLAPATRDAIAQSVMRLLHVLNASGRHGTTFGPDCDGCKADEWQVSRDAGEDE